MKVKALKSQDFIKSVSIGLFCAYFPIGLILIISSILGNIPITYNGELTYGIAAVIYFVFALFIFPFLMSVSIWCLVYFGLWLLNGFSKLFKLGIEIVS